MSNISPTQADNATKPESDSSIVDRTQQLIDEVNQLLGAGTGISTPKPTVPASTASTIAVPVAPEPVQTPAPEQTPLAETPAPATPAPIEPVEPVAQAEALVSQVSELEIPSLETPGVEAPTADNPADQSPLAPEAISSSKAAENSDESSDLSSFLNGLMTETPSPPETQAATPSLVEDLTTAATETAEATAPVEPVAEPASENAAESLSGFDMSTLNSVFDTSSTEEPAGIASVLETATPDPAEASVAPETQTEETIANETSNLLSELNSLVDESAAEPTEPVATEAPEALESNAPTEEVAAVEPAAEEAEAEAESTEPGDERSFTEKYLDQFRGSFDDDAATETENSSPAASEPEPTAPEPETEKPAEPDSAEMSVENWLARNIGNSDEEEGEDSEDSTPEKEASVADSSVQPTSEPTLGFGEMEDDEPEDESEPAHDITSLEASFQKKFRRLEKRIGNMFATLSGQLEGGIAAKPKDVDDTPVDAMTAAEVEELKVELKEKLRKAEVELSINRAKVSRQTVQLEQMQADLERREADLEKKLERHKSSSEEGEESGDNKSSGLMDRWKRHLG